MRCKECGGRLVLHEEGYYVCEKCGLLHTEERIFSVDEVVRERGDEICDSRGSYIFLKNKDNGRRLVRVQIDVSSHADYMAAQRYKKLLKSLQYKIGFSEKITMLVLQDFYRVANKWRNDEGSPRSYAGIIAALLYLRLKRQNINITLREIIGAFQEYGKKVSVSDALKAISLLRKHGYITSTRYYNTEELTKQIVLLLKRSNIIRGEYREASIKAKAILEKIGVIPGRSSRSIYIAVAYLVASSFNPISYREFSRRTGIPLSTLRENVVFIRKKLATCEAT